MARLEKLEETDITPAPGTFAEKLSNFWYYHKWKVIIGAAALLLLVICGFQMCRNSDVDLTVMYAGSCLLSRTEAEQMGQTVSSLMTGDPNGDGEKLADLCQLHIYSDSQMEARIAEKGRDSVNSQANQDELKTFDNLILAGEYSVVILEPWLYRRVASGGGFRKLSEVLGSKPASAYDDCAVRFKETALYNANPELFAGYTDDTLICLRTQSQIFAGKRMAKTYAEYEKLFADLAGG